MVEKLNDFKNSLRFTLKWEGLYSNDPNDPGGETKWGISKRAYPKEDIKNLTPERCAEIYADDYWAKCGCDSIEFPLNTVVFDTAVNCGVARARGWLRAAKSTVEYLGFRKNHYLNLVKSNPQMGIYLKGWLNRVQDLEKFVAINTPEATSKGYFGGIKIPS